MKYEFTVDGKPFGKQRPAFGYGRAHTPENTVNYENLVKISFRNQNPDAVPIKAGVPIAVMIVAYYQIPASTSKKRQDQMRAGLILPMTRPDIDNACKSILDALNRIAFYDDAQVVQLTAMKRYSDEPRVVVKLMEYAEYLQMCAGVSK